MTSQDRATVMACLGLGYFICFAWVVTSEAEDIWKWVFAFVGAIVVIILGLAASPDIQDMSKNNDGS